MPEIQVEATLSGTGRVRLMASDTNKVWRIVDAQDVQDADGVPIRLTGRIDRFVDGGGMWLDISTETGELTVTDVRWTVAAPRPVPRTDVVICTFNRVDDCLNTLAALHGDPEALATVGRVQVVDQGTDPLESRDRFAELAAGFGDRLRYVRQPNLGGAGGFTRGLFDATAGPADEHADVLLMDDDVLLEPEILIRLTAFAACTTHPTIVGGQMLNLLHPAHLHISAEKADPELLLVGHADAGRAARGLPARAGRAAAADQPGAPGRHRVQRLVVLPDPGRRSCATIGYPLPLFFQWDDIEFGYRARAHGFPTVALPGAGVWHADFGWKDWDEWHRYFNMRNGLITAALHTDFSVRRITYRLGQLLGQYLVAMHYGLAATLLEAVEDFLDGPPALDDGSAAAAAKIRRIRAGYPETVMHPMSELRDDFRDLTVVRAANPPGSERLTWAKRAAYLLADRAVHRTGFVPAGDAHWWHVSTFAPGRGHRHVRAGLPGAHPGPGAGAGADPAGRAVVPAVRHRGPGVARRYRAELGRLTSRANWARLYGVDE